MGHVGDHQDKKLGVIGVTFHTFMFFNFFRGLLGGHPPKKIKIKIDQKLSTENLGFDIFLGS